MTQADLIVMRALYEAMYQGHHLVMDLESRQWLLLLRTGGVLLFQDVEAVRCWLRGHFYCGMYGRRCRCLGV